jgi:hypothetical protein
MKADTANRTPILSTPDRDEFVRVRKNDIAAALLEKGDFDNPAEHGDVFIRDM